MEYVTSAISGTIGLLFLIAWIVLIVYTLLDIMKNSGLSQSVKLLWIIIILIAPILGSLIYLFWGRSQNLLP